MASARLAVMSTSRSLRIGGDAVERRLVDDVVLVERDDGLLDRALAEDEDEARHALVDGDEVDPPDVGGPRLGWRREAGRSGEAAPASSRQDGTSARSRTRPGRTGGGSSAARPREAGPHRRSTRRRSGIRRRSGCDRRRRAGGSGGRWPRARRGCSGRSRSTRRGAYRSTSAWLPTGTAVVTYSSMTARRIACARRSRGPNGLRGRRAKGRSPDWLALEVGEC